MTTAVTDELSVAFAALADPTRRAILTRLSSGEATVGQLAAPFALTQQAISKHIKVLEHAGLISRSQVAQARPCRLEPARFDSVAEWIDRHRQVWRERYDRLDQHLAALRDADANAAVAAEGADAGAGAGGGAGAGAEDGA
jgi:DNA-binding transcriptional ArsR family regulator